MKLGGLDMARESFNSRLGFILVSAGCAIGIGNVWRFPFITGENGGGFFVLFYLLFLFAHTYTRLHATQNAMTMAIKEN